MTLPTAEQKDLSAAFVTNLFRVVRDTGITGLNTVRSSRAGDVLQVTLTQRPMDRNQPVLAVTGRAVAEDKKALPGAALPRIAELPALTVDLTSGQPADCLARAFNFLMIHLNSENVVDPQGLETLKTLREPLLRSLREGTPRSAALEALLPPQETGAQMQAQGTRGLKPGQYAYGPAR